MSFIITSRQHAIVKDFRTVARGDGPRLLLDGWHLVAEALAAGLPIERLAIRKDGAPVEHSTTLDRVTRSGAAVAYVTDAVMQALSPVRTPSGVVAVAARPAVDARALIAPVPALAVAGFGIQDPGNVGALIRSADAGGATGVMLDGASADPWGWKALRASMGSAFRLPAIREARALGLLRAWRAEGLRIVAAIAGEPVSMHDMDFTAPTIIVVGGEGAGLPPAVLDSAHDRVGIPMRSGVDSLNVAVAAALLVYEAARQRGPAARP
jgi:TrmH family RNA methyltransferase